MSPDELRYGTLASTLKTQGAGTDMSVLTMQDREILARYLTLSLENRNTVCDVVVALAVAVTAGKWLSVLETSDLVMRLPPYHRNFGKRLVKTPKLYFLDVGMMAWLLGMRDTATLETHAARGALFETWVASELVKQRLNAGQSAELFFWRDNVGHEVDVVLETPTGLKAIEIKSGRTFAPDWPQVARKWAGFAGAEALTPMIVYGGAGRYARQECEVAGWQEFALGMAV